mmetsp:Transcript_71774/g.164591  ORF Transcript_71774/g.164591 Transcript_71774/m.164591 type:complete len:153 (+) Transcript_71774:1219-1677(+)
MILDLCTRLKKANGEVERIQKNHEVMFRIWHDKIEGVEKERSRKAESTADKQERSAEAAEGCEGGQESDHNAGGGGQRRGRGHREKRRQEPQPGEGGIVPPVAGRTARVHRLSPGCGTRGDRPLQERDEDCQILIITLRRPMRRLSTPTKST